MSYKLLLFCFLLCACTSRRMIQTDLYFGQMKPGGGQVTEEEWKRFKEAEITRVFKEGCTILPATGHWRDPDRSRQITEPTYVVVFFTNSPGMHPNGSTACGISTKQRSISNLSYGLIKR